MLATGVILLVSLTLTPLGINAETQKTFKLTVIDPENVGMSTEVREKMEDARGQAIRSDFNFDIVNEVATEKYLPSNAFAFNSKKLSSTTKDKIKKMLEYGYPIYLYHKLNRKEANEIFGQELFVLPDKERLHQELSSKGYSGEKLEQLVEEELEKINQTFDVIGAYKNSEGKIVPVLATINTDDGNLDLAKYLHVILSHINDKFLADSSLVITNGDFGEGTSVDNSLNHWSESYIGGDLVASINMDYYLGRDLDEQVEDYDHFALQDHMEFETFNGAEPVLMFIEHDLPFAGCSYEPCDNIIDWDPKSTTSSDTFSISLPWGISWSFNTNDDVDVSTIGSQTNDYVRWEFTEARTWSNYLHNPERVTPGNAWVSTGTYAGIDIENRAYFEYDSQTYSIQNYYDYRYDY
jgi:hypothetical protein